MGGDGIDDFFIYDDLIYSDTMILGLSGDALLSTNDANEDLTIDPNGTGKTIITGELVITTKTPASQTATGVAGEIAWDASYIYICTATNYWERVAISDW